MAHNSHTRATSRKIYASRCIGRNNEDRRIGWAYIEDASRRYDRFVFGVRGGPTGALRMIRFPGTGRFNLLSFSLFTQARSCLFCFAVAGF